MHAAPRADARWFGAIARRWRSWTTTWIAVTILLGTALLARPNLVPAPAARSLVPLAVMAGCFTVMTVVSWRELRLYGVARHARFLVTSLSAAFIAVASTGWMGREPFTVGWWVVHALDVAGVLGVLGGLWFAPAPRRTVVEILDPVLAADPLAALEVGLSPVVHDFVAHLERKDQATRDHVIRVGELTGRTAEALRLPPARLRRGVLGALLHDIGKVAVPDAVLTKPDRLTEAEYREVQRHPAVGAAMLQAVPCLADVAPIVRAHHERIDGQGYPDRLAGEQVPLEARIVATCDAYDAMAHTRHYRKGMGHDRAVAVLREHAGSQWDATVVDIVTRVTAGAVVGVFRNVGTTSTTHVPCACRDALPEVVSPYLRDAIAQSRSGARSA